MYGKFCPSLEKKSTDAHGIFTYFFDLECLDRMACQSLWTSRIWILQSLASAKLISQILHWKGFSFAWTVLIWVWSEMRWEHLSSQRWHSNGFIFSWTCLMCRWRVRLKVNFFLHFPHLKGRSFSWTDSMCRRRSRSVDALKVEQRWHWYGRASFLLECNRLMWW